LQPVKSVATSLLSYIPDLFFILVIVLFVKYLLKLSHIIFKEIESSTIKFSGFKPDWAMPTYKIVRFLILIFGLIVIFPYLPGSDSEAFKGVSIFLGVLFSLGSTSIVANAVAGLVLTYMDPFRLGDRVQIGESTGDVIEKTILVTRIKTIKNLIITIPNSVVMGAHIINFSSVESKDKLIIHTTVTLGYDVPWRKIHEVLIAAALDTEGVSKSPAPFVHQRSLDDFSVAYELNAYTRDPHAMAGTLSKLHASVQDHCNSAGIEILSPHYRAVRDGNESTIPKESKENTKAPALKKTFKEASKKINEKRKH
ncbi:MAG: mechanosensitive ion channel, partial [Leptospiraceae bacterium]|nr:mechanosensitive ion channel [Leptospiraceae bacterium]